MTELYIDATQPLHWGPLPPVGIPRVEGAIVRQALRQSSLPIRFFLVERDGSSRLLTERERRYLGNLLERRVPTIEGHGEPTYWGRLRTTMTAIRAGAAMSGKEFDRAAATYVSRRERKGWLFNVSKAAIRIGKLASGARSGFSDKTADPLADPDGVCFLSMVGMHRIAAGRRTGQIHASLSAILHDTIPVDAPQFFEKGHVAKFERDLDWMFDWCRQVVCVSEYTGTRANAFRRTRSNSSTSVSVNALGSFLREGLEGHDKEPVEELAGKPFVVYCATIEIRKNHIMLLRAWHKLMPLLGDNLPLLVICGRWGWKYEAVTEFLAEHPEIRDKVLFLADISDPQLAWLYQNARFGVFPSHAEGWGLGAAESLDFGLPVLVSDAPALAEATQHLMPVIPADDLDGWCQAIARASMDDVWLSSLRSLIATGYRPTSEAEFATRLLGLMAGEPGRAIGAKAVRPDPIVDRSGHGVAAA